MVQFGEHLEPVAVHRGGRRGPWLHARIDDPTALSESQLAELATWLDEVGVDPEAGPPGSVLVTFDDAGAYSVHVARRAYAVDLKTAPKWLRAPAPEPRKATKKQP